MQIPKKPVQGFSLLELMIVVVVALIIAGTAVPNVMRAFHTSKLRGTGSDFSGLLQQARIRAVEDDRYYSIYILAANGNNPQTGFVDIYPQAVNGASGTGGATVTPGDPLIPITSEVSPQAAANAPNTAALRGQFLPPVAVQPLDGNAAAGTPITFSPNGLPCVPQNVLGGTTCNAAGGPVAYWVFFQNTVTQEWEAVTVTPAGRIQKWAYIISGPGGGSWLRI